jgi:hypothetical protein
MLRHLIVLSIVGIIETKVRRITDQVYCGRYPEKQVISLQFAIIIAHIASIWIIQYFIYLNYSVNGTNTGVWTIRLIRLELSMHSETF